MWTAARFAPTGLFSLRPALATTSGAQTLLVPTPFAIKMALVDATIQLFGVEIGKRWWPTIRNLDVAFRGPDALLVNKTFVKVQRETDPPKKKGVDRKAYMREKIEEGKWPFYPTIAFREYVQFGGDVSIAVQPRLAPFSIPFQRLIAQVNYLGKRGGFLQLQAPAVDLHNLDGTWTMLTQPPEIFLLNGTLQMLDDCGVGLSWDHVDIYNSKRPKLSDSERVLRSIVLPYELSRSSRGYTLYERIEQAR